MFKRQCVKLLRNRDKKKDDVARHPILSAWDVAYPTLVTQELQ